MSYRADKQVIDTHTQDRYTDTGDDNTQRPKLASGKISLYFSREEIKLIV